LKQGIGEGAKLAFRSLFPGVSNKKVKGWKFITSGTASSTICGSATVTLSLGTDASTTPFPIAQQQTQGK
jgi:hypothetical protein